MVVCNNTADLSDRLFSLVQMYIAFLCAAVEIIADTISNSTFTDSDIDTEKANVLKELEVSFAISTVMATSFETQLVKLIP